MTDELTRLRNIVKRMDYVLEKNKDRSDSWALRKGMTEIRDEIDHAVKQQERVK